MNEEPRIESQGKPIKYIPFSADTPLLWRGFPEASNVSTFNQLKSCVYPVAQMIDRMLVLSRLSLRIGLVIHSGSDSIIRASGSSGRSRLFLAT